MVKTVYNETINSRLHMPSTTRKAAIQNIIQTAENKITKEYHMWPYHNLKHSKRSAAEVSRLFDMEKKFRKTYNEPFTLKSSDRELLILTATCHDVVQGLKPYGQNENASIKWLLKAMSQTEHFTKDEKKLITIAILGTKTQLLEDQLFQEVSCLKNGQDSRTILFAQIMADADLATLGMPWKDYFKQMVNYFKESTKNPTLMAWKRCLKTQSSILRRYHYQTEAAQKRYRQLKKNAQKIETLLLNEKTIQETFAEL